MATLDKTTQWFFPQHLTTLATNTTLAGATRHDFAATTVPLEASRSVKSAAINLSARDGFTTSMDFDGARIGFKSNAAAFVDVDYTMAITDTADHETLLLRHDCTAALIAGIDAGVNQSFQVGCAFASTSASVVSNIGADIEVTYDYDNTEATQFKTAELLLQGHHTTITTSNLEIGTTGGVSNAAANQIPQFTGAGGVLDDAEANATIVQIFARVTAMDAGNAATNFNLVVDYTDGATDDVRGTLEQAQITSAPYRDNIDLATMDTTTAHAFLARSSLTGTFENISVVVVVSYSFTLAGTTRELHSIRSPLMNQRGAMSSALFSTNDDDADRYVALVDIQEPGTITMLGNSGIVAYDAFMGVNGTTTAFWNSGQAVRVYAHANHTRTGNAVWTRMCTHDSSTWALARGINTLSVDVRNAAAVAAALTSEITGYALVNYTADVPSTGVGSGNRSVCYGIASYPTEGGGQLFVSAPEAVPTFPESPYKISGAFVAMGTRNGGAGASALAAERRAGEDIGNGWYVDQFIRGNSPDIGMMESIRPITAWIRPTFYSTNGMDLSSTRRWSGKSVNGGNPIGWKSNLWITYHSISYSVTGTYTIDGVGYDAADAVDVYTVDELTGVAELYAANLTTSGGGDFSFSALDNKCKYVAVGKGSTPGASLMSYISTITDGPRVVSSGTAVAADTTTALTILGEHQKYDVTIIATESNTSENVTLADAQGFVEGSVDSPQNATGTRLQWFWKRHAGKAETAPTFADPGDHILVHSVTVRGCVRTGNPWDVTAGDAAANSVSVVVPGDTTTLVNCLVLAMATTSEDSATYQHASNVWVNASLVDFREFAWGQTALGAGGGIYMAAGLKVSAGAYNTSTITLANSSTQGRVSIALKPHVQTAGSLDIEAFSSGPAGGGGSGISAARAVNHV